MTNQVTSQEYYILNQAVSEYLSTGKITFRCPRCGSPLIYERCGSAEIVRCENSECIRSIRRGI